MSEEVNAFSSSIPADRWIFPSDIMVDRAHTIMLTKQGIIQKQDAARILEALNTIESDGVDSVNIPAFEDVHMAIESKLIKLVGENTGGRMHSGRSRNDEVATCIRISTRKELLGLMGDLLELRHAIWNLAKDNVETIMPGFTHMQHAQPTTLAHHMMAHMSAFDRDFERLIDAFKFININPLGSAAFASTGFALDREYTTRLMGFDHPIDNSMDGVSARDFILDTISKIAILEVNLSRLADELILWSTSEFGFVELADTYASTSSIMPQKKNPDILELIRGRSGSVIGNMMAAFSITKALPYSYNTDLQEVTPQLLRSFEVSRSSIRIMTGAISTLTIKKAEMARKSTMGFTTATEIADTIVRATGLPFRTAHGIVGRLARGDGNPSLGEVDRASFDMIGKKLSEIGLTEKMLEDAKDPMKNVERRSITGGPAPSEILKKLGRETEKMEDDAKKISAIVQKLTGAGNELSDEVNKIISG
mgnify:FL=1